MSIFFILQFIISPKNINAIGFIFVRMCIITTLLAILLGILFSREPGV
ncbi:MAG: hypothetical protein NC912_04660 [Candidatus Omnitrophica bacterium]|nr:hypothetical protein [Candidatus Omnitrophota bacterium]